MCSGGSPQKTSLPLPSIGKVTPINSQGRNIASVPQNTSVCTFSPSSVPYHSISPRFGQSWVFRGIKRVSICALNA